MKKLLIAVVAMGLFLTSCNQGGQFKLTGNVSGEVKGKVYLSKVQDNDLVKIDSTELKKGIFEFTGSVASSELYFIQFGDERNAIQFFVENSNIKISVNIDNLKDAKITGSSEQDVFIAFQDSQKTFQERNEALYKEFGAARQQQNQAAMDSIRSVAMKIGKEVTAAEKEFIKANTNTVVASFIAYRMASGMEVAEMEDIYNILAENAKASIYGVKMKEKMDILKKVAVGQPAPDFTLNTPEGQPLSLSSFKGKVVVIDFWASWCGPCRKENPHMVELYNELHEKGVEFLGVSLDKDKDAWLKAIKDDGLVWNHVSDLKFWNSEAAKLYGVNGIPATVVIDKEGKIAAKKVFGDELKAAIEKAL